MELVHRRQRIPSSLGGAYSRNYPGAKTWGGGLRDPTQAHGYASASSTTFERHMR